MQFSGWLLGLTGNCLDNMARGYEYNQTQNADNPRVALAAAASITGLISVALLLSVYFAIILGGIAIVLAVLSANSEGKLLPQAKRGIVFGLIGLVGGYLLLVQSFVTVLTDPEARDMVNRYSEAVSGQSFDDMLEEIGKGLGISID